MDFIAHTIPSLLAAAGQPTDEEIVGIIAMLMIVVVAITIGLAISIVVAALLYSVQNRVPAEHRKIDPIMIWLLLIPIFNIIWNFFVFQRIPQSYKSYFDAQGRTDVGDCGKMIGLWYAICAAVSIVPCVNYLSGPAALVLLIIFLVKAFQLRSQLPASG